MICSILQEQNYSRGRVLNRQYSKAIIPTLLNGYLLSFLEIVAVDVELADAVVENALGGVEGAGGGGGAAAGLLEGVDDDLALVGVEDRKSVV